MILLLGSAPDASILSSLMILALCLILAGANLCGWWDGR